MTTQGFRLGCDIGGTFTDFVLLDQGSGALYTHKQLTTAHDPAQAFIEGVGTLLARVPQAAEAIQDVVHGTTLATNVILERKGAPTGLLTTRGFRDVLEVGREERYDTYDLYFDMPVPLIPRRLRREVTERLHSSGMVLTEVNLDDVDEAVQAFRAEGVRSVAVSFLHAYQNPAHEQAVARRLDEIAPELEVSVSSVVLPELREYERTSTTAIDAYVKPVMAGYLADVVERLGPFQLGDRLFVMLSSGGITSVESAREHPVRIIESGPAAGVLAAQYYARLLGLDDCVTFDIGGTTAKVGLVRGGAVQKSSDQEVDRVQRYRKGSGLPLKIPAIDILEIGGGGGSIARLDRQGLIEVGPDSTGADPGPACYGLGGTEATVSDADLLLGLLNPDYFLGGRMRLDPGAAADAVHRNIAEPLGVSILDAARGVHDLVNENMAAAVRVHCLDQGQDPARFALVAFGGAGPMHAYGMARKLGIKQIVVPPVAGIMSALGLVIAQPSFDLVRTYKVPLERLSIARARGLLDDMLDEAGRVLKSDRTRLVVQALTADMRYVGQAHEVNVPLPTSDLAGLSAESLRSAFDRTYERMYGHHYGDLRVELVNLRLTAAEPFEPPTLTRRSDEIAGGGARKGVREILLPGEPATLQALVYDRASLEPGARLSGPAVFEDPESTTIVGSRCDVEVDPLGGLRLTLL